MYAKSFIIFVVGFFLFCSCVYTTRTDKQILEYQRQIDRLEAELRARDRAVEAGIRELERITTRSSEMGADIDGIIRELDEYQCAVERLLQNYRDTKVKDTEVTDL